MSVIINFAMFPTDKGESASAYVSKVIKMIDASNYPYKLNPMGTSIETETMEEALEFIQKSHDILKSDCSRIYTAITIDYRKGEMGRMGRKIDSIESKIGKVNH